MRIGINILYLIPEEVGGTETYARNILPAIAKQLKRDDKIIVFASRETAITFTASSKVQIITLPFFAKNRISRILFEQTLLPIYCLRYRINVLFSLGYSQPIFLPCKGVVTIHDLNWYYHPEDFSVVNKLFWNVLTRLSALSANHIITDSQSSLDSIRKVLNIPSGKITKILHAAPPKLITAKKKTHSPYIFTVVSGYPHKNLVTLLHAFSILAKRFPDLELIVVGLGGKADGATKEYITNNNLTKKIKILGYVPKDELATLYAGALVFVFPSAYEGFGYPVLEAMSYQVPVISSSATSLSEVVGEGGMLVSPYEVKEYVEAITKLLLSSNMRRDMIKKGNSRIAQLSWEQTAKHTAKVIYNLRSGD